MSIFVVDTETNLKNKGGDAVGNFAANPHAPKNNIVYSGFKQVPRVKTEITLDTARFIKVFNVGDILVGQNIKFDLLYMMRDDNFRENILPTLRIWDTMVVEYLLTGQQSKFTNLDALSTKYGGTLKDKRLEELWSEGVDTEDIDGDIVKPYLGADVNNTTIIFQKQLKEVMHRGILPLIKSQMDALLATTEMEYNGMYFDKEEALRKAATLRDDLRTLHDDCYVFMESRLHTSYPNVGSVDQVSLTLFGGYELVTSNQVIEDEYGNPVKYKSGPKKGTPRTRKVTISKFVAGCSPMKFAVERKKKKGFYVVNDDVLRNIYTDPSTHHITVKAFVDNLMKYRKLSKDLKTYYEGYSDLVWPHDSCIHGTYNHCQTATGRLSHSNPNLGNVSHKE